MKKSLKDYFIPHDGNEYKPHSLQKAAVLGMVALVLLSFASTNLQALLWQSSNWLISTVLPAVIVELTNEERSDEALVTLRRSATLDVAAQLKAEHMAENQYFAHYSPDGVSPWHWFGEADYNFVHAGENLAIHFSDSTEVVTAWMNSPTHRANILNGDYREIGIGIASGTYEGYNTVYVVQLFGTPAAATPAPVVIAPAPVVAAAETTSPEPQSETVAEPEPEATEVATAESEDDAILAESVAITEQVEVFESEPVAEPVPVPKDVAEVITIDDTVVVVLDHLATSTGGIPASINTDTSVTTDASFLSSMATQPHLVLQILYGIIASFVVVALMLAVVIEWRRQHPIQIAYSVALLLLMLGLYQVHTYLLSGALVV